MVDVFQGLVSVVDVSGVGIIMTLALSLPLLVTHSEGGGTNQCPLGWTNHL